MKKLALILGILFVFLLAPSTFSQETQKGITVVPSMAHIDLSEDRPEYEINYTNNTDSNIALLLSVEDFTSLEDSYKIKFLEGKDAKNYKYSLSSWIAFGNKTIQLSPKETKSVKIFIDRDRITKGGHYASILAEIVQENQKDKVNVRAILSSLLFVRASTGQELEIGAINAFKPIQQGIEYPESYLLRFENKGNVHVIPYGLIQIYDPLGNLVAKGALNEGSLDALPESIRRYDTKVTTYQKVLLPGIYTANISMHFGKSNVKLESQIKFFSQGGLDMVKIGILVIIIIALLLYYFKKIKSKHE